MLNQNVNINIRCPKYLRTQLDEIAKEQNTKYSKILRQLIKDYIKQYKEVKLQNDRQRTDTIKNTERKYI